MVFQSRWIPEEKIRIVMESLNTNASIADLCRKYNVTPNTFYDWKEKFIEGGKAALSVGLKTNVSRELEQENERLKTLIGELTIANSSLKKAMEGRRR